MSKTSLLYGIQLFLLLILLLLLANVWFSRSNEVWWHQPVRLAIYPVNADGEALTQAWIDQLRVEQFQDIELFFNREASRYRLPLEQPVRVQLAPQVESIPPQVPEHPSILDAIWWSLKMQVWVVFNDTLSDDEVDARVFMNFHLPHNEVGMRHSLGLQRGLIGLVNGYAGVDYQGRNNLIATHEFLHTLGASDKYNAETTEPLWPDGYADPTKVPLFPQTRAEIMGGRVQVSPGWALLPPSLEHVVVGAATAIEINWLAAPAEPRS
ncbi:MULTISPECIES: hypothetical protein [Marinobacterium]|jgi:hypothetical protein|uniref:Uncharacterized protein n=1 Tax=Marinobacterium iners DSM 11526 TaxID=1122198 RepID=A0A1H4C6N8_9GAMM|nr:hypothetical protein [Marinobacterium iners]SEA56115.1 hypothetical protein SAMN02745729_104208 [Marinobacterium iners DSM 11526]